MTALVKENVIYHIGQYVVKDGNVIIMRDGRRLNIGQAGDFGQTEIPSEPQYYKPKMINLDGTFADEDYKKECLKNKAREDIRNLKDNEDDLTDLKKVVQFMARGFAGLWFSLPQDIKDVNPYKDNFNVFSQAVVDTNMRLDLEVDQTAKIIRILEDEAIFATIVKTEYLDKV